MNVYKEALLVQDACNMSGIARSLVKVIDTVRANGVTDTSSINSHPAIQLFCDKMVDLARCRDMDAYSIAYKICKDLENKSD